MRKLFIISVSILTILLAIFVILPLFSGMIAENKLKQVVSEIATFSDIDVKVTEYHRHWFTSDASIVIDLSSETTVPLQNVQLAKLTRSIKLQQITLIAHIMHGPVIITQNNFKLALAMIDANLVLNEEQSSLLQRVKNAPSLVSIHMGISILGKSTVHIHSPQFSYQDEARVVKWQELDMLLELSPTLQKIKRTIAIPDLELTAPHFNLQLIGFNTIYRGEKYVDGLWIGDTSFLIQHFSMKIGKALDVIIDKFQISSSFKVANGYVSGSTDIALQNASVNGKSFTNNSLVWSIDKFKVNVLAQIEHEIHTLEQFNIMPSMPEFTKLLSLLGDLLNNGATIIVDKVNLHTPWGELYANGKALFPARPKEEKTNEFFISNFQEELNLQMQKKLSVVVVQTLFWYLDHGRKGNIDNYQNQAQLLLSELVKSQAIISENDFYSLHLTYKNQQLLLNDKPFSITQN